MRIRKVVAALGTAILLSLSSIAAHAWTISGWADVTFTKTDSGSVVDVTITVDTTSPNHLGEALISGPANAPAGKMLVDAMMTMCSVYPPTNFAMDCTSYQPTNESFSTSSDTVMTYVMSFSTSQWDAMVSMGTAQGKSIQVAQLILTRSDNTRMTAFHRITTGSGSGSPAPQNPPTYAGPVISSTTPVTVNGGVSQVYGKKLDSIHSIKVNGQEVKFSTNTEAKLEIELPAGLQPGSYDLEALSSFGKLLQYRAIIVKAPTQPASFSLKGSGSKMDAYMLTELSNIGAMFDAGYKKITCVVNAEDAATAQALAEKVCKTLKAGELRKAKTKSVAKTTFKGDGYWVRVYLAG